MINLMHPILLFGIKFIIFSRAVSLSVGFKVVIGHLSSDSFMSQSFLKLFSIF